MNMLLSYLDFCQSANSLDNFCDKTFEFIKNQNSDIDIKLIQHAPGKFEPVILKNTKAISEKSLFTLLKNLNISESLSAVDQNYKYFFSGNKFRTEKIMIFMIDKNCNNSTDLIMQSWQKNYHMITANKINWQQKDCNDYGNLISQLLHDVNSLTEISKESVSEEAKERYTYQKKTNRNLLFFLRDFDLFKSEIEVKKLITDSLSLLELNQLPVLKIEDNIPRISLDVELFSTALNEIVKNAIKATEGDISKISTHIFTEKSRSPFLKDTWIVFEVTDLGKGINKEFLPFIKNPFFTTYKYDGHSGFGLSNAEKIIKAHGGWLEIDSQINKTTLKIYLPEK